MRLERSIQAIETQIAFARDELSAAKVRVELNENELAAMKEQNRDLQSLNETTNHQLKFLQELSRLSHYETPDQLLGLPACVLKEARNQACVESFKDSAGNPFNIGGPGASWEVAEFIQSLEDGKTYSLPAAFIEFQRKQKRQ